MKRGFCVLAGTLLLVGLPFAQHLGSPFKVATAPSAVRWSQMAFAPNGVAHIIYELMDRGPAFDLFRSYLFIRVIRSFSCHSWNAGRAGRTGR